jgi:hypothetical protein
MTDHVPIPPMAESSSAAKRRAQAYGDSGMRGGRVQHRRAGRNAKSRPSGGRSAVVYIAVYPPSTNRRVPVT